MAAPLPPETLDSFGQDELRARVFWEKYALRGPDGVPTERTPDQMWDRLARELSREEPDEDRRRVWEREFRWLLADFRFVPGGRIMHAVGQAAVGRKAVPINCFVLPLQDDSLVAIYELCKEMAVTFSRGGGVGIDISPLRPKGAVVHNAANVSTGAVSFMETFSLVTGTVGQAGRRGALMITIRDDHPDVLDFCRVKRDLTSVRYANISALVSDAFMRAVEQDGDWRLHFENPDAGVVVERVIKARDLWEELITGARDWAEPGCLFIDTARRRGTTEYNGMQVLTTNPCVAGDTRVSTSEGLLTIAELAARTVLPGAVLDSRVSPAPTGVIVRAFATGRRPVVRILTEDGYELTATGDHKVLTATRGFVPASALTSTDVLLLQDRPGGFGSQGSRELGRALGWSAGCGATSAEGDGGPVPAGSSPPSSSAAKTAVLLRPEVAARGPSRVPEAVWQGTEEMVCGFLQGLFTSAGAVCGTTVRLGASDRRLLTEVQLLLLNLGIPSRLQETSRQLVIRPELLPTFAARVGFLPGSDQQARLEEALRSLEGVHRRPPFTTRVARVVPVGTQDVYDLTEALSHTFIANGLTVSNCGEQFLDPYSSCCLGSLNLLRFVRQPFADLPPEENVDWAALRRAVRGSVRFLDNVITYSDPLFPLDAQREAARRTRRIGLGVTALADLLAAVGLRYDTEEAVDFAGRVMEAIKLEAYRASSDLAEEKGPFPLFDPTRHLAQEFFREFPEELVDRIRRVGLRNAALMTVPPVGSGSVLAGVTSGIEPIFGLAYVRRSESLTQETFRVVHPLVHLYFRAQGGTPPELPRESEEALRALLPPSFVTAHEIDPVRRVAMQAAIQAHVDNAVSSTVNLPRDVSVDTVARIYRLAWTLGCKGITVYREGSREGVLLTAAEAREGRTALPADLPRRLWASVASAVPGLAPAPPGGTAEEQLTSLVQVLLDRLAVGGHGGPELPPLVARPERLEGPTYRIATAFGTAFITITEMGGEPFEVFGRLGKGGTDAEAAAEAIGRMASILLRLRSPVPRLARLEMIAEQLERIGGSRSVGFGEERVRSIPDAFAVAMRKYMADRSGMPKTTPRALPAYEFPPDAEAQDFCPHCHQATLVTTGGCTVCTTCGFREC